jgi:hypothetical protein
MRQNSHYRQKANGRNRYFGFFGRDRRAKQETEILHTYQVGYIDIGKILCTIKAEENKVTEQYH